MGKIFKPDLRKEAITRIYDAALVDVGSAARITSVTDDKKRGLVAQVAMNGASEAEVGEALGSFTRPWEAA